MNGCTPFLFSRLDMKKFFLTVLSLLSLPLMAQTTGNATLVLHHADGTTTDIALFTQPRVTFTAEKLCVTSPVLNLEYPAEEVLRFTFKDEATSITMPQNEADYQRTDGWLIFQGVTEKDQVAVYASNGIRVPVRLAVRGDKLAMPLNSIPQGVYVLSVNGRTSKFTKQ